MSNQINYLTNLLVRDALDSESEWEIMTLDLSQCGIAYRTGQTIMIMVNASKDSDALMLHVHPDDRLTVAVKMLEFETLLVKSWEEQGTGPNIEAHAQALRVSA